MRLLQYSSDGEFKLTYFFDDIPAYAILSHTWGPEEVTFKDMKKGKGTFKTGFDKIRFCGEQARRDGLQYFWVDTCCIDKSSSTELAEAINSMFQWYHDAAKCYVFLSDVSRTDVNITDHTGQQSWESSFRTSRWFTRGWTLQELLAPDSVEFFSREGERLGDKWTLEKQIHEITRIAVLALRGAPLSQFDVEDRFLWAKHRQTTRDEDNAYSLFGIFDIQIPLIYGEGGKKALKRLREEIYKPLVIRRISDYSESYKLPGETCHAFAVAGAASYAREAIEDVPLETWSTLVRQQGSQRPAFPEHEAPLPNIALSQETPSATTIDPSVLSTSLAIDEDAFEVGPIRDLLAEIKSEFAKGRRWGLKPAVFHQMGVVTCSLLLYEQRDIAGTHSFFFTQAVATGCLVATFHKFVISKSIFEFNAVFIAEIIFEFTFEFTLKLISDSISEFSIECIDGSVCESIYNHPFTGSFTLLSALKYIMSLGCSSETIDAVFDYISLLSIYISMFLVLIAIAQEILVFSKYNRVWTHGHLRLNLNGHVYDHTWAAIGTENFRALKLEVKTAGSPIDLGTIEAQERVCASPLHPCRWSSRTQSRTQRSERG